MNVRAIITRAAQQYGLPPEAMLRIAQIESGLRPDARNPNSSASGLFQFIDSTWKQYGRGDRMDPAANADAAARYLRDIQQTLRSRLGRDPSPWELYLGHQQGPAGAPALLANPDVPAVEALAPIYGSRQAARRAIALNLPGGRGNPDGMTAGDFARIWEAKYNRTRLPAVAGANAGYDAPAPSGAADVPGLMTDDELVAEAIRRAAEARDVAAEQERQERVVSEAVARIAEEDRPAPACPPGSVWDPSLQACVPLPEDAPQFRDARLREQAEKADPLRRFDVILDALPFEIARIR